MRFDLAEGRRGGQNNTLFVARQPPKRGERQSKRLTDSMTGLYSCPAILLNRPKYFDLAVPELGPQNMARVHHGIANYSSCIFFLDFSKFVIVSLHWKSVLLLLVIALMLV